MSSLWGGCFSQGMAPLMERFNQSIDFDRLLFRADIQGSKVYAQALNKSGLINDDELKSMHEGLNQVLQEWESGDFKVQSGDEDIHTANERRLKELIGKEIGGKLHTGRSRNDQVATDMRLWMLTVIEQLKKSLINLLQNMLNKAESHLDVIFPGYTHLQRAQPVLWSHWLLNHAQHLRQDLEYLDFVRQQAAFCPLGSGALAGNPFSVDRQWISDQLGFDRPTYNSMSSVGDRDFIVHFQYWATLVMVHCSRLAEDVILYSSKEFAYVTLSDEYSTGSSLMPQKKNPDSLELVRGKTGRVLGNCVGLLTVLKGTPSTFNKDLQEDKEGMFDTFNTVHMVIEILSGCLPGIQVHKERCLNGLSTEMLATDVAYYLVRKKMPFRDAHEAAGRVVKEASINFGNDLSKIPLTTLQKISPLFTTDIANVWDYRNSVDQYTCEGGTATNAVKHQLQQFRQYLQQK